MSASAAPTKIFGIKMGDSPKKIIALAALLVVAIVVYKINSGGDETGQTSTTVSQTSSSPAAVGSRKNGARFVRRSNKLTNDRATLRLKPVNALNGEIDPTLRLDLLARLQAVEPSGGNRSLFEPGAVPVAAATPPKMPKVSITPAPMPGTGPGRNTILPVTPSVPPIPLKFYGFVKPKDGGENRGFFMDGDNILVGAEGETLNHRYRIIRLTLSGAVMEDTTTKNQQTLPLIPEVAVGG